MNSSTPSAPESTNDMILTDDETAEELSADEVAIIFGFLSPYDIMHARVCTTWRDAAKKTVVPPSYESYYKIYNVRSYNAVRAMSTALPNLDQLDISDLEFYDLAGRFFGRFFSHGTEHNKLSQSQIRSRYVKRFPLLEVLDFRDNQHLTGNISRLRAFKGTLKSLYIWKCLSVRGNFMEMADFPRLKELELYGTPVTGDIRNIRANDFPALESLNLPDTVHGGMKYKFRHVSEVPSFMHTVHLLSQRTLALLSKHYFLSTGLGWTLSEDSPDWYDWEDESEIPEPPFHLQFVRAGSRRGWSWCTSGYISSCEINWLDPEPNSESGDYGTYIKELHDVKRCVGFYRGYYQPPTEAEYRRLFED